MWQLGSDLIEHGRRPEAVTASGWRLTGVCYSSISVASNQGFDSAAPLPGLRSSRLHSPADLTRRDARATSLAVPLAVLMRAAPARPLVLAVSSVPALQSQMLRPCHVRHCVGARLPSTRLALPRRMSPDRRAPAADLMESNGRECSAHADVLLLLSLRQHSLPSA
ncbi:hypothetical protein MANAM107_00560 [Actinomyces capricornis]|uniref:Uncharacterized protein n=1 Tax=Actinomyces capricornis TaxID=2755559 RepID=A0ABM7U6R0_9ACTO|nr:hypothetical protein MANAM107_00560 [Actinomyces capricornis]